MARPRKIDPVELEQALQQGLPVSQIARGFGVDRATVWRQMRTQGGFATNVSKRKNFRTFAAFETHVRKAIVCYSISRGNFTKVDIMKDTGFSEWIVRECLDLLQAEGVATRKRQSQPGAVNPYLYTIK